MLSEVSVDTRKLGKTLEEQMKRARQALPRMANSLLVTSLMKTPLREGPLRDSGKVEQASQDEATVSYGNEGRVPYARYQERGSQTGKPWHYTTPGTGPHFLADATAKVVKKGLKTYL